MFNLIDIKIRRGRIEVSKMVQVLPLKGGTNGSYSSTAA
jgi:hypothetical protein